MLFKSLRHFLLNRKYWGVHFTFLAIVSAAGLTYLGYDTYAGAPPLEDFTTSSGDVVVEKEAILDGKEVFHRKALMNYGSLFGDGAERGPDFTADALHRTGAAMRDHYERELSQKRGRPLEAYEKEGIAARVARELHDNGWNPETENIEITQARAAAFESLVEHYHRMFNDPDYGPAFSPTGYISEEDEIRELSAFFFWASWVSAADRPGTDYSYTHNWPYDPEVGNTPTSANILWSILAIVILFVGIGGVLYVYGQFKELPGGPFEENPDRTLTTEDLEEGRVRPGQRATYKFFVVGVVLFLLQVLAGIGTAGDFVGLGESLGLDLASLIPVTVARSWHIMLQILWFFVCWIGYSIFFVPVVVGEEPPGQRRLVDLLFGLGVLLSVGVMVGIYLGPMGYLGEDLAYWLGSQGWEFHEFGRLWHLLTLVAFLLWVVIIFRGVKPALKEGKWSLPAWLVYAIAGMVAFFFLGLLVTQESNFAISDFWRWMTVHMWVEATFEVFTTVIVAYLLVLMGLTSRKLAERTIFLAVFLFLATAILGIAHNFYWIAKPTGTLALGSVFSTLQVLPLLLLTLDAWQMRQKTDDAEKRRRRGEQEYVMGGVWLFILATNFWNIFGAGVFGSMINLPIINYFEHSTYLTGNHAHAAMFGVKGNVALAGVLFCCRHLIAPKAWSAKLIRTVFWSLNGGLVLMMVLDLFPVGLYQFWVVLQEGLWYARSHHFVGGQVFQTFTWLRSIGGTLFLLGGVVPLVWFVVSRARSLR